MNFKNLFLAVLLAVAASCVKVDYAINKIPTNSKGDYAILFSKPQTKAQITSVSGTGYDSFNLFTWNSINDTIMNPYIVKASGEGAYQYENIDGQELQYFKRVADWYNFIGVIPTTHQMKLNNGAVTVKDITSFTVDDKRVEKAVNLTDTLYWSEGLAAESPEEFLTAYRRVEKADYGNVVELPFKHQNALIFLGFSSDQTDTKLIDYVPGVLGIPAYNDTTDTWINLKRSTNVNGSATTLKGPGESTYTDNAALPDNLVAEIKSYYSINNSNPGDYDLHLGNSVWHSSEIRSLRVVKDIPAEYKMTVDIHGEGILMEFFDGFKYLKDNGYDLQPRTSGGKPMLWEGIFLDSFVNGTAYTMVALDWGHPHSIPQYTIVEHSEVPGVEAIKGVRVFSADSLGVNNLPADTLYCVHIPHTVTADAVVSSAGCTLSNRITSNEVIQFSLPETTTLSATPVWSPTSFYALPGDVDFNFIVVKLSYIYKGITVYDVRVPIHLPDGGLQPGKYYKYELYITSTSNGTNDSDEASDEKDEILIEDTPVIQVKLIESGYTQGDERQFKI